MRSGALLAWGRVACPNVTVDLDTSTDRAGRARLGHHTTIDAETARRLAYDAHIHTDPTNPPPLPATNTIAA